MAVVMPCLAESDVSEADRTPGEESSKTRKGKQPIEDDWATGSETDECDKAAEDNNDNRRQRTTGFVDIREQFRSITLLSKGSQGTRTTVDTRDTN